jgi:hypothetical protein
MMIMYGKRVRSLLIPIILTIVVSSIFAAVLAESAQARPPKSILPKPYIMNRGDGDTINGKYFIYDTGGDGELLYPGGPLMNEATPENSSDQSINRRIRWIKWIVLYRLIK